MVSTGKSSFSETDNFKCFDKRNRWENISKTSNLHCTLGISKETREIQRVDPCNSATTSQWVPVRQLQHLLWLTVLRSHGTCGRKQFFVCFRLSLINGKLILLGRHVILPPIRKIWCSYKKKKASCTTCLKCHAYMTAGSTKESSGGC